MTEAQFNSAIAAFEQAVTQAAMGMAAAVFAEALSPGGQIYEQIMAGAIASALMWYGMYSPKRYKRGYTLSDRGNISISAGGMTVSGTTIHADVSVANVSPHAGYAEGFRMRGGQYRPGGDLMGLVPGSVTMTWDAPADVISGIVAQAAKAVFGDAVSSISIG